MSLATLYDEDLVSVVRDIIKNNNCLNHNQTLKTQSIKYNLKYLIWGFKHYRLW
jgi:hypothetical protein